MIINYILVVGLLLDLLLTYKFLGLYKKRFPNKDYTVVETNPLLRYMVRTQGLGEGIISGGGIILMVLIALIFILPSGGKHFLAGAYYMMIVFHLTNFLALNRLKGGTKKNGKEKEYS